MKFIMAILTMVVVATAKLIPETLSIGLAMVNYADSDNRRNVDTIPLADALDTIGVRAMRFPGGLEASSYLWATAPSWSPSSHKPAFTNTSRWPISDSSIVKDNEFVDVINFDEFMVLAGDRDVSIVVNFDSMYADGGPTKELLIETVRQWVIYVKKTFDNKKRTVYWEIGNESDLKNAAYNGHPANGTQYGVDFIDFASAMREEDPDAIIGMNGSYEDFMIDVLNVAGEHIDFIAIHPFPINSFENGYNDFLTGQGYFDTKYVRFSNAIEKANISKEKKSVIFAMITETNVIDWAVQEGKLKTIQPNDVAAMTMLFDTIGRYLEMPRIRGPIFVWGSHWIVHDKKSAILSVFDQNNNMTPLAYAMRLWASIDNIVSVRREDRNDIKYYEVLTTNGTSILVINTSGNNVPMNVSMAYHNDDVHSSAVLTSSDLAVLPAYAIALI
jgi:hypothetical protein